MPEDGTDTDQALRGLDDLPSWAVPLILGALCGALVFLMYALFYLNDEGPGDFAAHSDFKDVRYSWLFVWRDAVSAATGLGAYDTLYVVLSLALVTNVLAAFALFARAPGATPVAAALATAALFLFGPVWNAIDRDFLMGQFSPNVWHNSTFLISWLPNLVLFVVVTEALRRPVTAGMIVLVALASVWSIGAKPSYFVTLAPALGLYVLLFTRSAFPRLLALGLLPIAFFLFHYLVLLPPDVSAVIAPGAVWSLFTSSISYSIFVSIFFFLVAALAYGRSLTDRMDFGIAVLSTLFGMLIFFLLAEQGERYSHSNFVWGLHQATAVLLFVTLRFLVAQPIDQRLKTACVALVPHVVSGVLFGLSLIAGASIFA